jgi:hypothetical protein
MTDPRRPEWTSPPQEGSSAGDLHDQALADPAYAEPAPAAQTYGGQPSPWARHADESHSTLELPAYWQEEQALSGGLPRDELQPPPEGARVPRWLWFVASAAVLMVVALVIALILADGAVRTQTAVPPLPAMPESSSTTPSRSAAPSTSRRPQPVPPPSGSGTPTETTEPATLQSVIYHVNGDGRAISITYMDTGDMVQTEFNVALPWSKEVRLSNSAAHPAIVTVINIGHNVTCSLTIAGVQVRQREGVGLTICNAPPG